MTHRSFRAFAASLALAALATDNHADTLTKKDGRQFDGRVVAESPTYVTFESNDGGITLRQRVARTQIRSHERQVLEGTWYCTIPLSGGIGDQVTAAALQAAV